MKWVGLVAMALVILMVIGRIEERKKSLDHYRRYARTMAVSCIGLNAYGQSTETLSITQFCHALGNFMATTKAEKEHPDWFSPPSR